MIDKDRDWVIFDLDGTLADITHRLPEILDKKYDASMEKIMGDRLKEDIFELYDMCNDMGYNIAMVTGRSEKFKHLTERWLSLQYIHYDELHMRPQDDYSPDFEIKETIFSDHFKGKRKVVFVVDDRQQVVDMWRRNGITCLQCQQGDY